MEIDMEVCDAAVSSSYEAEELSKNVLKGEFHDGINYPPLPEYPPSVWKYEMRREMQEICPRVFYGSYGSANSTKLSELISAGFTHIVCVRHMLERRIIKPNFPDHFVYKIVEMNESSMDSIIPQCLSVCEFISENLDRGGKVLIHGNSGAGSSATLIIAFVMFRYGLSSTAAFQYVQQRRFCIRPTESFLEQLHEFVPIFKARHQSLRWSHLDYCHSAGTGTKRTIDDVEEIHTSGLKRLSDDGCSGAQ